MRRYLKYIVFNAVALALTIPIIVFGATQVPSWAILPEAIWIVVVVAVNTAFILKEPKDYRYALGKEMERSAFRKQLASIGKDYAEVLSKNRFFSPKNYAGPVRDAYLLIRKQMESNIISALEISVQHKKDAPAGSAYMDELATRSDELVEKQSELIEKAIRLKSVKDDVDVESIEDFLKALDAVLESDDLTFDAYSAKYGEGDKADG